MSKDNRFGEKVKHLRQKRQWTQQDLENKSGLSQSEICKVEKGTQTPKEDTIKKLANAFETEPEALVKHTSYAGLFHQTQTLTSYPKETMLPLTAYFGSALTGLNKREMEEIIELDQEVDQTCNTYNAYPIILYRPRLTTSPIDQPNIHPLEVYKIDRERVATADILILAAIFPSLGAGMELQLALQSCSTIIIIKKENQKLSRMVEGCPARKIIIEYKQRSEINQKLTDVFDKLLPSIAEYRTNASTDNQEPSLGKRIKEERKNRRIEQEDLAKRIGVDTAYIKSLEDDPEEITNPSITIIRKIAKSLGISESYLINGYSSAIHKTSEILSKHYQQLWEYTIDNKLSQNDHENMWNEHITKHGYLAEQTNKSHRTDGIGTKEYWNKLHKQLFNNTEKARNEKEYPLFQNQ